MLSVADQRSFAYASVYFDTPDLALYHATARRRPRRYKVRTRTYVDVGRCLLELKVRDLRGRTTKERTEHDLAAADDLGGDGLAFLSGHAVTASVRDRLEPVLWNAYRRSTLVAADGLRITLDTDLRSLNASGGAVRLESAVVLETKSDAQPSPADRLLWSMGHRPITLSKYGSTLAAMDPALPSNRWTRVLRAGWVRE